MGRASGFAERPFAAPSTPQLVPTGDHTTRTSPHKPAQASSSQQPRQQPDNSPETLPSRPAEPARFPSVGNLSLPSSRPRVPCFWPGRRVARWVASTCIQHIRTHAPHCRTHSYLTTYRVGPPSPSPYPQTPTPKAPSVPSVLSLFLSNHST